MDWGSLCFAIAVGSGVTCIALQVSTDSQRTKRLEKVEEKLQMIEKKLETIDHRLFLLCLEKRPAESESK